MKLSVAIAKKDAPSSAFVVWRGFEESIKKAALMGFNGVELALKSAKDIDRNQLDTWLSKNNMEVSCISTGQVFAVLNLYFTHPDKEVRDKAICIFTDLINLAKDYGKLINVGRVRGFIDKNQTKTQAEELFLDTANKICEAANKKDVTIIIEPVNRYEINFVNNLDQGAELIRKLNSNNIGLMPDTFHMNIEDDVISSALIRNADLVKYVHFADSNRLSPGCGHLDFDDVFDGLYKAKFNGWISVEILPEPNPDEAALKSAEFLLPRIDRYNQLVKENI